jgi:hypothetical protein
MHQRSLLFPGFYRDEPHRWPRHRLADRRRIVRIVFAALQVGLYIARRHQLHCMTNGLQLAGPVMGRRTSLDANEAPRQTCEKLQHLRRLTRLRITTAPTPSTPCTWNTDFAISRPIVITSPMDGSLKVVRFNATTLWHFDAAQWAPSTASKADSGLFIHRWLRERNRSGCHHREELKRLVNMKRNCSAHVKGKAPVFRETFPAYLARPVHLDQ